jgi:protein TonB
MERFPDAPILPPSPVDVAPTFVSYVAPIPVRKVSPTVPVGLRSLIQDGTSVEVKVMIDAEGEVIRATPVDASSAGRKLLSPSAVQAAMLWRFEPARRNGQPVGSETTLTFSFETRAH